MSSLVFALNSNGDCCLRNPDDIIVIEWPSEGILADRALQRSGLAASISQIVSLSSRLFDHS